MNFDIENPKSFKKIIFHALYEKMLKKKFSIGPISFNKKMLIFPDIALVGAQQ